MQGSTVFLCTPPKPRWRVRNRPGVKTAICVRGRQTHEHWEKARLSCHKSSELWKKGSESALTIGVVPVKLLTLGVKNRGLSFRWPSPSGGGLNWKDVSAWSPPCYRHFLGRGEMLVEKKVEEGGGEKVGPYTKVGSAKRGGALNCKRNMDAVSTVGGGGLISRGGMSFGHEG